jgi:phytanoyl-CoA hydroxylase
VTLSATQQAFFDTNGYIVVEDVLPAVVIENIRAEYSELLTGLYEGWRSEGRVAPATGFEARLRAAYAAECDWFQPMDISLPGTEIDADTPFHIGPAVFDMLTAPGLLDVVETLIGPEITSTPIQHVRIKPPASLRRANETRVHLDQTDWHQDRGVAHAEADETKMITVWLAITDATEENGCLQVIPGAHREALKTHCPSGLQLAIPDQAMDKSRAVPLPVKSGGAVIFDPGTPHASLENNSDGFRWSFDIRFNQTGQPTGRNHFPDFIARSSADPSSELRNWRAYKHMWEDARARLSDATHIPIHRWDPTHPVCA